MIYMSAPQAADQTAIERTLDLFASQGDKVAMAHDGHDWTFADLLASVRGGVGHLADLGVTRGSVVAVLTGDRPETFTTRWAGNALGAAVLVVPDGLSASSLSRILTSCNAGFLIADDRRRSLADELAGGNEHQGVRVAGLGPLDHAHTPIPVTARPSDVAAIRLTGGSTGVPKAIPRLAEVPPYLSAPALAAWADTVQLLCTPVAHLAGTLAEVVLAAGGRVVVQEGFDVGAVLTGLAQHAVTWIWLQPRHLHRLLDEPALEQTDLPALRSISLGSAPSSPHRLAVAVARFGPIITSGYGTQEANQVTWLSAEEHTYPELRSTVGRAVPGVELSIRGEDGSQLPAGSVGEIWVRGPSLVSGYLNAPQETVAAFTPEGWFRTGDLGCLDDAGYLTVAGRAKDVILAEHDRVYPTEVEEVLLGHPKVAAAAVFGLTDPDGVETVAAAVVPRLGSPSPAAEDLRSWVAERGRVAMAPSTLRLVDQLPTTSSAKVDRDALQEMFGR
jgi:fatty-acyl-CoA synthase